VSAGTGVKTSMTEAYPLPSDDGGDAAPPWDETCPDSEKRSGERFTLLIRTAKLVAPSGEYLCVIRDVSQEGLKARLFQPLPVDEPLDIELATGDRERVEPIWQQGDLAGFRFTTRVPLERLLAAAPPGRKKRPVRLHVALPVRVVVNGQSLAADFRDISQHGASLECAAHLAVGQRVHLECEGLPPLDARVRWRRQPHYGVIFEQTFRFDELARLVAALRAADRGDGAPRRRSA
jgi:hypothetical protein